VWNIKSIWNGSISFGLVNIPVRMYSAIQGKGINFKLLEKESLSPIKYYRTCATCDGREIPWSEVVKGIELEDGEYFVISQERLRELRPKRTDTIEITEFIDGEQVDKVFIDKHYYLGPERKGQKTYHLFRGVLQRSAKAALGKFVLRDKEHLCTIEGYGRGLLLTTLNYRDEIREISDVVGTEGEVTLNEKEVDLAEELIERMTGRDNDIGRYENSFENEIRALIERYRSGERETFQEGPVRETDDDTILEALLASLED